MAFGRLFVVFGGAFSWLFDGWSPRSAMICLLRCYTPAAPAELASANESMRTQVVAVRVMSAQAVRS